MNEDFKKIDTVRLSDDGCSIEIIDQTRLPGEVITLTLKKQKDIFEAIKLLQVRGAPAIGVTAALSMNLAAKDIVDSVKATDGASFMNELKKAKDYLDSSRPTAVNLSWATDRILKFAKSLFDSNQNISLSEVCSEIMDESLRIYNEDIETCRSIGEYALTLVKKGDGLLTHCNAGRLATVRYGTATSVMYLGQEKGYDFKIYCDETRPLLQGARLTAFELAASGMDVTLLCDNMSASLLHTGMINAIFVGCDRVAANGDTANKIGTSLLALAAKSCNVPFYVCAPTSNIDMTCKTGADIIIEQRPSEEVTDMWYKTPMAPKNINVYNPAFDVTDAHLITGIITEKGIYKYPYFEKIIV